MLSVCKGWCLQVLDTGMGTPKHPLFLLGKTYSDADHEPDQATTAKHTGPLRRWWAVRKGHTCPTASAAARYPAISDRVLPNVEQPVQPGMQNEQILAKSPGEDVSSLAASSVSSLPSSSFSSVLSVMQQHSNTHTYLGQSLSQGGTVQHPMLQSGADVQFKPMAAHIPDQDTALHHVSSWPATHAQTAHALRSDLDLEAQRPTEGVTAAVLTHVLPDSQDAATVDAEPDQASAEPEDVATERARVEALWAARQCQTSGNETSVASPAPGPAILLHNLRKVYKGKMATVPRLQWRVCHWQSTGRSALACWDPMELAKPLPSR